VDVHEQFMWRQMLGSAGWVPKRLGLVLRAARALGVWDEVSRMALDVRRSRLGDRAVAQRSWGASVSRRPQRNRHHDSWVIREGYVRCDRPWSGCDRERQEWCNGVLLRFPEWGVAEPFQFVRRLPVVDGA